MKHALTALALLATLPAPALAETNGTLGASSTGSLKFSLNVEEQKRIQISGLTDVEQTIETGRQLQDPANTDFENKLIWGTDGGLGYICVKMDEGGLYSLDWSVTPLSDGPNVESYDVTIYRPISSPSTLASRTFLNATVTTTPKSGSASNIEAQRFDRNCGRNSSYGRLAILLSHGSAARRFNTPGTYTATITFTVRPE